MPFIINRRTKQELDSVIWSFPEHLQELLKGLSHPPTRLTFKALRPLFTDETLMEIFGGAENAPWEFEKYVKGTTASFVLVADRRLGDATGLDNDAAFRAVSFLYQVATGDERALWFEDENPATPDFTLEPKAAAAPAPGSSFPPPEPPKSTLPRPTDPRMYKMYDCTTCKQNILGLHHLYAHHIVSHDGKWAWHKLRSLVGDATAKNLVTALQKGLIVPGTSVPSFDPVPAPLPPKPAVKAPMFEMTSKMDLRGMPDGRYAWQPEAGDPFFVIKRTVKRRYTRRGRFIWGKTTSSWTNIPVGVIELRKQSGDTKELFGEQWPDDPFFRGEYEAQMEHIMKNPAGAAVLYGKLLGKCAYCGRSLTDELSRLRGIGPDCWEDKHIPYISRLAVAERV